MVLGKHFERRGKTLSHAENTRRWAIHGIAGKINRDRDRAVEPGLLERMQGRAGDEPIARAGMIEHAPVALGFHAFPHAAADASQQPAVNEDGLLSLVFTGRIFNAAALCRELAGLGHTFRRESEAEAILHGFEQWGNDVTHHLRGPFAIAIYDRRHHVVHLLRDRIGGKPLYYAHLRRGAPDECLVFASDLKSLLAEPLFERRVDIAALSHYLTYQHVPHPWSIFEQARKVPPGSRVAWADGEIRVEPYWELRYEPKVTLTEEDAIDEALARIDDAIHVCVEGAGPIGCFLSGGTDSSTVVALARRHIPGDLKTFSIGFREQEFNELPFARKVAEQYSTQHVELVVEPDALECLGELAWHFGEPMADMSAIPTWYASKLAREHVATALNGDGGDESFAGYSRYQGFRAFNNYRRIPRPLRVLADAPFAAAAHLFSGSAKAELLSYVNHASIQSDEKLYTQTMVIFREYQKRAALAERHRGVMAGPGGDSEKLTVDLMTRHPGRAWLDRMTFSDISFYLPGALIPKVERTANGVCLDLRAPLLDQRVMEFAATLPPDLRFRGGTLKYLMKKAIAPLFEPGFHNRPKMGFGVPIGEWIRGAMRPLAEEYLLGEHARARGFFDHAYVRRMLNQHLAGAQNHHHRIWVLIMLEAWCRTFLDRQDPLAGPLDLRG